MKTVRIYAPGAVRNGPWRPRGACEVHIAIERGFDCRVKCEHLPARPNDRHGQEGDWWYLACRRGNTAVELILGSWIRNGVSHHPAYVSKRPLLHGTGLFFHHGDRSPREKCHLFADGCDLEGTSAHAPDALWGQAESDLLAPLALQAIEKIDLDRAYSVLEPVWTTLIAKLEERFAEDDARVRTT